MAKKHIEYFLNRKLVSKNVITKRKNKTLDEVVLVETRFYNAPLNKKEKEEEKIEHERSDKAFREIREQREELEARHG